MTIEIGSLSTTTSPRASPSDSKAGTSKLSDALAAGQIRLKQMAADFEAQRRQAAQATLGLAKKQILDTFHSAIKLRALGGDMHFMVDMVDSALRMAQPAIKTLRNSYAASDGPSALTRLAKQVRDLTNVAEEVGLVARMAAGDPGGIKRVGRSWSYLSTTLQQTRELAGMIFVI